MRFGVMPLCEEEKPFAKENDLLILRQVGGLLATRRCIQLESK